MAEFIKPWSTLLLTGSSLFHLWLLFCFLRRAFDFVEQSKKAAFNGSVLIFFFLLNGDSCKGNRMQYKQQFKHQDEQSQQDPHWKATVLKNTFRNNNERTAGLYHSVGAVLRERNWVPPGSPQDRDSPLLHWNSTGCWSAEGMKAFRRVER